MGRRNGQQPQENMQTVLANAMRDAKELIDKVKSLIVFCL